MGPEFNDKRPCRREAEEGCEQKGERPMQRRRGGSEAGVVQPSLGCDRPPQTRRGWNRKGSPAKH